MSLSFKRAEDLRFELTVEQQHEIRKLYRGIADDLEKELNKPLRVPSDAARQQYLRGLQEQINEALADAGKSTNAVIRANALSVAESIVECNSEWLGSVGLSMTGAYSWVPQDVVQAVATGQIYDGSWSLSGAIWADVQTQQRDIQTIIARGIAENKSAFDIAKDLEKYVDPSAAKPWDWSKVYPGVRRQIDYNAQRLARTMVSHAYQQAFVRTTQKNPFVTQYKWEASNSDRVCELCQDRDGKLFDKDDLPLDHPNGMCTYTAVIEDSMDQVADRLADWVNGAEDPALDTWAKDMYGDQWNKKKQTTKKTTNTAKGSDGLTDKQRKKAKEWDQQYERVADFARSTGRDVDATVKSILGDPPVGSIHRNQGAVPVSTEANAVKQPKSSFRASQATDMTREQADDYIKALIKNQGYSQSLTSAMDDYMMFSDDINGYLRGTSRYNEYGASSNLLTRSMHTGTREIVYRGCDSKTLGISPVLSESQIKERLIGSVFRDKGFLSTSKTSDVAMEFSGRGIDGDESQLPTVMTILVPEDAKRLYVNSGLGEVLLNQGSGMEITEVYIEEGILRVTASVVP